MDIPLIYKYIHFERIPSMTKTSKWICLNNKSMVPLGIVKWLPAWRQYCFFPEADLVFSVGCLKDICEFIGELKKNPPYPPSATLKGGK